VRVKHRRALAVVAVLVTFAAALVWWSSEGVVGAPPAALTKIADSAPATDASSQTATGNGPLAGDAYRPGNVLVVFRVTGDPTIGAVAYRVQGGQVVKRSNVRAPMAVTRSIAPGRHVALLVQVAPNGHRATCSIAVNGVIKVSHTARGPYRIVSCMY
jgi:hypothetical protein